MNLEINRNANNTIDDASSYASNLSTDNYSSSFPLKIATLNCRSLRKSSNPTTSSHFIRYLRTQNVTILALQETHANTTQLEEMFHTQFQATHSVWSSHCGLVCFSPDLSI